MSASAVKRLHHFSTAPKRTILGLMSGTSLDGLDLALCEIEGVGFQTKLQCSHFVTAPYDTGFRERVLSVFAKEHVSLEQLVLLNKHIADQHAVIVNDTLANWGVEKNDVDLIASHGQTVYHAPLSLHGLVEFGNATLQLGDGDHIAQHTGIITCSDFRQKHVAAGGEGAPLATYGDALLLSAETESRLLLNIGGIANFTWLPSLDSSDAAFSSDIGPGNTLMDALMQGHFSPATFDKDASIARSGKVHTDLIADLRRDGFFARSFPKTTGPEQFNLKWFERSQQKIAPTLTPEDAMATLNRLSAETIAEALDQADRNARLFVSGGGARNPLLMQSLQELMPTRQIDTTLQLGIDPDAKEAILFAVLANELVAGNPAELAGRIKDAPSVSMGKISLPG